MKYFNPNITCKQNDHKIEFSPIESRLQNSISLLVITFPDFYSKLSKTEGRSLKSTSKEVDLFARLLSCENVDNGDF